MGKRVTVYILLVLMFFVCGCKTSTHDPKTYVLSIGIADYLKIQDLRLPEKDAEAVTNLFNNRNSDVLQLLGAQANKSKIIKEFKEICSKAGRHDRVIFYFSGHGYPGGFCPYDMSNRIESGIQYEDIFSVFKQCKSDFKMIIADACYSGGIRVSSKDSNSDVQQKMTNSNVVTFLSSRTNETSIESPFMTNGIFTNSLIRGLKGGADNNRDKQITAKELFNFVSQAVKEKSRDRQHPVMWGKFRDDVVIVSWQ